LKAPAALLLGVALAGAAPRPTPTPAPGPTPAAAEATPTPRPDDKTLVAALDIAQGNGRERVSLYRDGTLALSRTYEGVRTLKKKLLSPEEVDLVDRVCSEALKLDVSEFRADVLGSGEPRTFRVEVGRAGEEPRVFRFDELAGVPLPLGRARGALEGLLERFDEKAVSQEQLWDPAAVKAGDVLVRRGDERLFRVVRDDTFVRSVELLEIERNLERLIVLREELPKLFRNPVEEGKR
jgi:hypothetical protein